ncbi:MAG TPA: gluconokinase [Chitinophagaceae bacterium]|nr:gluconokinase [Chitinophagaceae bacterium]
MNNSKIKNAESYFIGVDIGTGSAKAVAMSPDMKVLATSQSFYSVVSPKPGYSELAPATIRNAFIKVISEVISQIKRVPVSVSISTAMHSLMAVDAHHKPLTRFLTWEDTRSDEIAAALRKSSKAKGIYAATGTPIHSMSPLCKIRWMKENRPDIFTKASKFISIKEFIWFHLFHEYEVDHSIASATGLFNLKNLSWHLPSLKFCGITAARLSRPVATDFLRDNVNEKMARDLQIDSHTKFCIGASDGCLANVGSYATDRHTAALTIGTSGAVRVATHTPVTHFASMIFNYILDDKTYISGGPVNNGGNVMKWLFVTFLNKKDPSDADYKMVFEKVRKIPAGAEGLIFVPYLYGERAPIWDEKSNGAFIGIQSFHTTHHFFRAAMEGICFSLKNILDTLESSSGRIRQLHVSGGFSHSEVWMQVLADITGKKLCKIQSQDASCIGATLWGMKATGVIKSYQSKKIRAGVTIHPHLKTTRFYKEYFSIFKNLYPSLKDTMHLLNTLR